MSGSTAVQEQLQRIQALSRSAGPQAALALTLRELAVTPGFELWVTAAGLALRLEQFDSARNWLQLAHQARPDFLPVRRQLSQVLNRLHAALPQDGEAPRLAILRDALQLWPENVAAGFNLAQALLPTDPQQALQLATGMLQHAPADLELAELIAQAAAACGKPEPIATVTPMLLAADRTTLLRHSAGQLAWNGAPRAATPVFARLSAAQPANTLLKLAAQLSLPACYASTSELEQARAQCSAAIIDLPQTLPPSELVKAGSTLDQLSWSNFLLAYQGRNDCQLQSAYGDWLVAAVQALNPLADPRLRQRRPGRQRIGLLSSFWRECTVGAYFGAWVGALAGADKEITLISIGGHHDGWTARLEAQADHALRLSGPLAEQARRIAELDLDLLIYPELGMHGLTLVLAALRLARRQWCGWGHPVSCGLSSIDRQISVASMEPPEAATHYREPLLLLPGLGTRYALPDRPPVAARQEFGLPEQALLIVLPSSAFKLHPDGDAELATLLAARPQAVAVLLHTEPLGAMQRLRTRLDTALRQAGADPLRQIHWLAALPRERFLALLGCCDALLDPWHWSGGNTALDALHMGLPILTRWGSFMRGRQSAAMLEQLGLPGVNGQSELLDHAPARQAWRIQAQQALPMLVDGARALQSLREAVDNTVDS